MNQSFPKISTRPPQNEKPPVPSASGSDTLDIGALASVLWRGKYIILLTTLLMLGLGGYYAFVKAVSLYTSSAVVMLENREESVTDIESVIGGLGNDTTVLNTEVEVLRSRQLIGKVVDKLNLTEDPEFNPALVPPSTFNAFKSGMITRIKSTLGIADGSFVTQTEEAQATAARNRAINQVLSKMTVKNVPLSLVFRIGVETENPRKSALLADTIVDLYILNQREVKFDATQQATSWLTDRVSELQTELETAESKAKDFSANTDVISPEALAGLERQLKETRDRAAATQISKDAADAQVAQLKAASTPEEKAAAAADPQLERMLPQIDEPAIAKAFDTYYQQLITRAELNAARAQAQLTALTNSQATLQTQIEEQNKDLIQLQQLNREAEASRLLYEYFLGRLKETSAQQGIHQADSRVLSEAVISRQASFPNKPLILALSGFLGLIIGAAIVLFRESQQNTFRTPQDLEARTGYTVMGQIPLMPVGQRRDSIAYLANKPTSAAAEALRNLRTSLLLSSMDRPPQVIMTTSSLPGEGKTTMSLALTQNFSGLGKKVLLIEGDIRRRVFGQYMETDQKEGLLTVLAGEKPLSEVVLHNQKIGADILIGQQSSTNAADIFSSERFQNFIAEVRTGYDIIIIDTPPVLIVPDARVIAQQCDAILFTVRWDHTQISQVQQALHMFETVGQRVSGLVLNQISQKGMKRYGYGGQYGNGSGYYTN